MIKLVNRLGVQRLLPPTIVFKQVPLSISMPYQSLYGRGGGVKTGKATIQPRQFSLEGRIYYPDKMRIRQELDELLPFLMQSPIEVYKHHEDTRFLRAQPLGAPQNWIDEGAELGLQVQMIALDPYWYGPEVTVDVSGTQAVEVEGTAPVHPLIRTTGSVSGLAVTNHTTNETLIVSGAGVIEVDNDDFTCRINGENRLDAVNDEWVLLGFSLVPGENEIETNRAIEMIYRPKWY